MRRVELLVGLVLLFGSTFGYFNSSNLVVQSQGLVSGTAPQLFPKMPQANASSNLFHVNQPQVDKMVRILHYGFIALAICGLAALCYGVVAKKQNPPAPRKNPKNR